jgi:hypothetical protein
MIHRALLLLASLGIASASAAATLDGLAGHDDLFGRYAPGGDCQRQPRIVADESGLSFEVAGKTEKATRPEQALGYFGPDYQGISKVIFPFTRPDGEYPIALTFHSEEKPGVLVIEGHAEGYPGGPLLAARNKALVDASPYARCK